MRKSWTGLILAPLLLVLVLALSFAGCGYDCTEEEFDRISSESEFNKWMDACADKVS